MAVRERLIQREQQPQEVAGVNWTNPITDKLGGLFDTRAGIELVHNNPASNLTTLLAAGKSGQAADFSSTANQQYAHRPSYATTGAMTIFALMEVRTLTNYTPVIAKEQTTTTNIPYEFYMGGSGPTTAEFTLVRASGSSGANVKSTIGNRLAAAPGVVRAIAITVADGLLATVPFAYVDKVRTTFATNSTAGSATDVGSAVWIGRRYDGVTQLDGRIYFVALWNRELSGAEIASLTDNPWQLFEDQTVAVPVVTAGTNYPVAVTDSSTVSEQVSALPSLGALVTESCTAAETLSTVAGVQAAVSEVCNALETVATAAAFLGLITESATAAEQAAAAGAFQVAFSDTVTALDAVSATVAAGGISVFVAENVVASVLLSTQGSLNASIAEGAQAQDAALANAALFAVLSEAATLLDEPRTNRTELVEVTEGARGLVLLTAALLWNAINDSQTPNWQNVPDAQTPGWTDVNDTQAPGWQDINN